MNAPVNQFAGWSAASGAIPLVGDFDGLGASDIALTGVVGWNTLPVAVSNGAGFDIKNPVVGDFAAWATTPNVKPIVGDFNTDGKADVALTGAAGWSSVPIAFSGAPTPQWTPFWPPIGGGGSGGGVTLQPLMPLSFTVTNYSITDFAGWSSIVQ